MKLALPSDADTSSFHCSRKGDIEKLETMVLALVIHTVPSVSAKVPFSMIALLDAVKRRELPEQLKCRQVFPTSGKRSTSLWDVDDIEALQVWLDEFLDVDCKSEVFEVQEDFCWGISAELTRIRTAERVSANARATAGAVQERTRTVAANATQQMGEIDAKFRVSSTIRETSQAAAKRTAAVLAPLSTAAHKQYSKALENERVAAVSTALNNNLTAGWKSFSTSLGFLAKTRPSTETPATPSPDAGASVPTNASHAATLSTEPAFANSGTKGPPSAIHKPDASREQTSHLFTLGDEDEDAGKTQGKSPL